MLINSETQLKKSWHFEATFNNEYIYNPVQAIMVRLSSDYQWLSTIQQIMKFPNHY